MLPSKGPGHWAIGVLGGRSPPGPHVLQGPGRRGVRRGGRERQSPVPCSAGKERLPRGSALLCAWSLQLESSIHYIAQGPLDKNLHDKFFPELSVRKGLSPLHNSPVCFFEKKRNKLHNSSYFPPVTGKLKFACKHDRFLPRFC